MNMINEKQTIILKKEYIQTGPYSKNVTIRPTSPKKKLITTIKYLTIQTPDSSMAITLGKCDRF